MFAIHFFQENDDDRIYTHHWIEPPDPVSNIRKCEFAKQKNPNKYDIKLEKQQEETFKWNSEFWTQHNQKFFAVCLCPTLIIL